MNDPAQNVTACIWPSCGHTARFGCKGCLDTTSSVELIRRIDAMQACQIGPSDEWSRMTKSGYSQAATDCSMGILKCEPVPPTLSAAMELPEVRALVYFCKYLIGENDDHLRISIAGNPDVIDEMQDHCRAALAPFKRPNP